MASRCPLCQHEFTFVEVLRRWNPFGSPCPHCRNSLAMKNGLLVAALLGSVVLPICWVLWPLPRVCGISNDGFEALIMGGLKLFAVIFALGILAEWIFWKIGWPGYMAAGSNDAKAARFWMLFLVAGLPGVLAVVPTATLFHWSGVFAKNAEHRLEFMPKIIKDMQESKLTLEKSRKLIMLNLSSTQTGLQSELLVCRALRIHSGLVLLALAWFLFWSYRMIFHPSTPSALASRKSRKNKKQSSKPRAAKRGR